MFSVLMITMANKARYTVVLKSHVWYLYSMKHKHSSAFSCFNFLRMVFLPFFTNAILGHFASFKLQYMVFIKRKNIATFLLNAHFNISCIVLKKSYPFQRLFFRCFKNPCIVFILFPKKLHS